MKTGPLLIFFAAILWGLDGILRRSLFDLPPITIVFFEHVIGAFLIAPFFFRSAKTKFTPKDWGAIGLVSLFSGVLGTLFFTTALLKVMFIPFSVVFLIQKLQPIFAIGTSALVLRERITKPYLVWAVLALIAGYFVTFPEGRVNLAEGGAHLTAALFAFLAAICWGSSTAFSRYLLLRHSNTAVTALRFFITAPLALIAVFFLNAQSSLQKLEAPDVGTLFLIAFSTGLVALWIYYRGLKQTPVMVATIVELAFPLTAIFIDYFLYDTALAWSQYLAAAVLLFAMYKVGTSGKRTIESTSGEPVEVVPKQL